MHKKVLEGRFVLQMDEIVNMAAAARERYSDQAGNRCLKLALTDGCQQVVGVEHCPLPGITWDCPAGSKLVIHNVPVRRGLLLLGPDNTALLGGQVERLEAARQRAVATWNRPVVGRPPNSGERDIFGEARQAAWAPGAPAAAGQPTGQQPQPPQLQGGTAAAVAESGPDAAPPGPMAAAAGPGVNGPGYGGGPGWSGGNGAGAAVQQGLLQHGYRAGPPAYERQQQGGSAGGLPAQGWQAPAQQPPPPHNQLPPRHTFQSQPAAQGLGQVSQGATQPRVPTVAVQSGGAGVPQGAAGGGLEGGWMGRSRAGGTATVGAAGAPPGGDEGQQDRDGDVSMEPVGGAHGNPGRTQTQLRGRRLGAGPALQGGGGGTASAVADGWGGAVDLVSSSDSLSGGDWAGGPPEELGPLGPLNGPPGNPQQWQPGPPQQQQHQAAHPLRAGRLPLSGGLGCAARGAGWQGRGSNGGTGRVPGGGDADGDGIDGGVVAAGGPPADPHTTAATAAAAAAGPPLLTSSSSGLLPPRPDGRRLPTSSPAVAVSSCGPAGPATRTGPGAGPCLISGAGSTNGGGGGIGLLRKPALPLARSSPAHSGLSSGSRAVAAASPSVSSHGARTAAPATASAGGASPSAGSRRALPLPVADVDMVVLASEDDDEEERRGEGGEDEEKEEAGAEVDPRQRGGGGSDGRGRLGRPLTHPHGSSGPAAGAMSSRVGAAAAPPGHPRGGRYAPDGGAGPPCPAGGGKARPQPSLDPAGPVGKRPRLSPPPPLPHEHQQQQPPQLQPPVSADGMYDDDGIYDDGVAHDDPGNEAQVILDSDDLDAEEPLAGNDHGAHAVMGEQGWPMGEAAAAAEGEGNRTGAGSDDLGAAAPPPAVHGPGPGAVALRPPPCDNHAGVVQLCHVDDLLADPLWDLPVAFPVSLDVYGVFQSMDFDTARIEDGTAVVAARLTDGALSPLLARCPPAPLPHGWQGPLPSSLANIQAMADSSDAVVQTYGLELVDSLMTLIQSFVGIIRLQYSKAPPAVAEIVWLFPEDSGSGGWDGAAAAEWAAEAAGGVGEGQGGCGMYEQYVRAIMAAEPLGEGVDGYGDVDMRGGG